MCARVTRAADRTTRRSAAHYENYQPARQPRDERNTYARTGRRALEFPTSNFVVSLGFPSFPLSARPRRGYVTLSCQNEYATFPSARARRTHRARNVDRNRNFAVCRFFLSFCLFQVFPVERRKFSLCSFRLDTSYADASLCEVHQRSALPLSLRREIASRRYVPFFHAGSLFLRQKVPRFL